MKRFNLTVEITGAADEEEITIILDQIKRHINDGYKGGFDWFFNKFDWTLKETEEPEPVNR